MNALKGLASKMGSSQKNDSDPTNTGSAAGATNQDPTMTGQSQTDPTATGTSGKGDFLDQGVGMAGTHFGKNLSRQDQEKYSDGIRTGYTKAFGSDVPIKDQN